MRVPDVGLALHSWGLLVPPLLLIQVPANHAFGRNSSAGMWRLAQVRSKFQLWFSDGAPVESTRGGFSTSSRLIVEKQGFLDLTVPGLGIRGSPDLDANGLTLPLRDPCTHEASDGGSALLNLALVVVGDGSFELNIYGSTATRQGTKCANLSVTGKLKPLPDVSFHDAAFLNAMIEAKYVPYQEEPNDVHGKAQEEIRALGQQLFPFSPYSFELAMSLYDWTTPSFTRLVYLKIFEYTGIDQDPSPLDETSLARMIYASNWGPYTARNPAFMNSFMMFPASSERDVQEQLKAVAPKLHELSDVQNRLLAAGMQAMPRTSVDAHTQLFSGQVDIHELGLDHFGIEFLECPLNAGSIDRLLTQSFETVLNSFVSPGKIITTKMVWSFTDTLEDAMHYSNGILLVVHHPRDSAVWNAASYITPLSIDPAKTEYTFPPRCQFEVLSTKTATYEGKQIVVIELSPTHDTQQDLGNELPLSRQTEATGKAT